VEILSTGFVGGGTLEARVQMVVTRSDAGAIVLWREFL
jgi:hypothetical protein